MSSNQELESAKNVDYSYLRNLLKDGNWQKADQETLKVMLEVTGGRDWIRLNDITLFSCVDLLTIDNLWLKYSNRRFGFSVQKEIYMSCGGEVETDSAFGLLTPSTIPDPSAQTWYNFGRRVNWAVNNSWISYSSIKFNTASPSGHLPALCWGSIGGFGAWLPSDFGSGFSVLITRLAVCQKGEPSIEDILSKYR